MTEGLFFVAFCFYNPSASHSLGTSLYTREAVAKSIITQIGRENNLSAEILLLRTGILDCPLEKKLIRRKQRDNPDRFIQKSAGAHIIMFDKLNIIDGLSY